MFAKHWQAIWLGVVTFLPLAHCGAAVRSLDLPATCIDFAMHPDTGDVVALATAEKDVLLFRSADLQAGKTAPAAKIHIDSLPRSVCYKQFGEKKLFVVACSHESQILLLNASDLALVQKLELGETYAEGVGVSANPADPFLYYSSGDLGLWFINLRDAKTRGMLFPRCGQFALSADGDVLYFSGNETPAGLMSMKRASELTETKPVFKMLRYADNYSPADYLPDPHNFYTAVGEQIFTKSLDKQVGSLDFSAYCFLVKQPMLVGFEQERRFGGSYDLDATQDLQLIAASTNTFEHAGESLVLPARPAAAKRRQPARYDDDVVQPGMHVRVFADEAKAALIVGHGDRLHVVPIADLKLPKEPFLRASLQGPDALTIGKPYTYQVKSADPDVKVEISSMPDGMKAQGAKLMWSPTATQIGPATVELTLKHGKIERTQSVQLRVNHPQIALPFVAYDFAATPDNKRILVWEKSNEPVDLRHIPSGDETCRIALIDLETEKVIVERKLKRGISMAAISLTHAALRIDEERCEVLKLDTLQREKSLVMDSGIQRVSFFGRFLVLSSYTGHQVYDTEGFKLVKEWDSEAGQGAQINPINGAPIVTSGISDLGLIANGILYDRDLRPLLFFKPAGILQPPGSETPWNLPATDTRSNPDFDDWDRQRFDDRDRVVSSITQAVPEQQLLVDVKSRVLQRPARADEERNTFELWIATRGGMMARQTLLKSDSHVNEFPLYHPKLQISNGTALVLFQKHFFRWQLPAPDKAAKATEPLTWKFKQTEFVLDGIGKTVLKHEAKGGSPPYKYSLLTTIEAAAIDESTGDVTIDESALGDTLYSPFKQQIPPNAVKEFIRSAVVEQGSQIRELAGRPPKGIGIAVPIHVQVIDSKDDETELKYFVVAELPEEEVEKRLKAAAPVRPAVPKGGRAADGTGDELEELKRRLSAVEARLDLMTRQMTQLLKKLED